MTELQFIGLLAALLTLCGGVVGIWVRIEARIKVAADEVKKETADAKLRAEAAHAYSSLVEKALARHELHAAETFVTKSGLRDMREEIVGRLDKMESTLFGIREQIVQIVLSERRHREE